jgi:beta-galactosidase GanA
MNSYFHSIEPPFYLTNFDYFRLPPARWSLYLTRLAQLGFHGVVLPLPWLCHETAKGQIDFTGATHPRRDVITVIKLCAALNLTCVLAPGPARPHHGLLNNGLPLWLPPRALSRKPVTGWYSAVSQATVPYQWPQGPITACGSTGFRPIGRPRHAARSD